MILVTRTLLATRKLAKVSENVELVVGNLDEALEQDPGDALVAGWSCQRAQVGPVTVVVCKEKNIKPYYFTENILLDKLSFCASRHR